MGHAVMTHTQNQPTVIHLNRLPRTTQDAYEYLMDKADQAADRLDLHAYAERHNEAIQLLGICPPDGGELARCTCTNCYCEAVFDAAKARTHMNGTVEFVQCETCADEHRLTGDE
ncbi:hypothetical protein [Streptomyces sp. NPDC048445]|uniref:hypothetical protein n=1 Tax=Streptomyces sp. NPDC048445 TaxID=3365553 RepID=UPI0037198677